jgi:hypothetical protein
MPVVIEELEVQAQVPPEPRAPPPTASEGQGGALDERALHAALAREAWRRERLVAD